MKVGIIQSSFIPWRGYFDLIASVDLFVFLDDVQYTRRDWRNRNRIKTLQGLEWLTVPVKKTERSTRVFEVRIDDTVDWRRRHGRAWQVNYGKCSFYRDVRDLLGDMEAQGDGSLSQLNQRLIRSICDYLKIKTPFLDSRELKAKGEKTDRLISILKTLKATRYLSGPFAEAYLEKEKFNEAGIELFYKSYDYLPYPQLWGEFQGGVSVLDLIANCGTDSLKWIRSQTPDQTVIGVS